MDPQQAVQLDPKQAVLIANWNLIVRAKVLVVWNRRQPVADQSLDRGRHAICNPILAEIDVQTAKV